MRAGVDTLGVFRSPKNFSSDTPTNTPTKQKGYLCVCGVGLCCFGNDIDVGSKGFGVVGVV